MTEPWPLLLLDVDGVLNAISGYPDRAVWPDWQHGEAHTHEGGDLAWPILYSPTVMAEVRRWHELGRAEIRWLSTWQEAANGELRELLDLPEFPVEGEVEYRTAWLGLSRHSAVVAHAQIAGAASASKLTGRWWKFDAVLRLIGENPGRPMVWLDDDLAVELDVTAWMRHHTTSLLLAPTQAVGLGPRLLREVGEFLDSHHAAPSADPARPTGDLA